MPSNVSKFVYGEDLRENFRNLVMKIVEGNVILSGEDVYAWWLPRTSPMSSDGAWYQLKSIEYGDSPTSLWSRLTSPYPHIHDTPHIRKVVEDKKDCFIVPMKDILYHYSPHMDGSNFTMYVKHEGIIYDGVSEDQVEHSEHTLYSLMDNSVVLEPKPRWGGFEWIQTDNLIYPEENEPTTPSARNSTARNLVNEFDHEAFNNEATMRLIEESYASDDDYVEPLDYVVHHGGLLPPGPVILDNPPHHTTGGGDEDDEDYEDDEDSASSGSSYDDYYDEFRQDVCGGWYTRRQFYDFYGSEEAWDNLDTRKFQSHRLDESDCLWYTKEQFYQYYGTNSIWNKMHPKKQLLRQTICNVYKDAMNLPHNLQSGYIFRILATY
jgi:hypothetical protein